MPASVKKTLLRRRRPVGKWALGASESGQETSFWCWIAGQRARAKGVFLFTDTGICPLSPPFQTPRGPSLPLRARAQPQICHHVMRNIFEYANRPDPKYIWICWASASDIYVNMLSVRIRDIYIYIYIERERCVFFEYTPLRQEKREVMGRYIMWEDILLLSLLLVVVVVVVVSLLALLLLSLLLSLLIVLLLLFGKRDAIHHHLPEAVSETATVLESRQLLPYTTLSGWWWWWCVESVLQLLKIYGDDVTILSPIIISKQPLDFRNNLCFPKVSMMEKAWRRRCEQLGRLHHAWRKSIASSGCLCCAPNLPAKITPTKIAWLKLSGKFPMSLGIPP